jgi:hypothetical protein
MVTVPIIAKAQPRAPSIPAFLFQNPQNKSPANSHSEPPKTHWLPGRRKPGTSRKKRAVADERDQRLRLVLEPLLVSEKQEDEHHRRADEVVVKIIFEKAGLGQDLDQGVH